jgi:phage repressor protein C with HTH and peptisase S24 domain
MSTPESSLKTPALRRKAREKIANEDLVDTLMHHSVKDTGEELSGDEVLGELVKRGVALTLKQCLEAAVEAWEFRERKEFQQIDLAKACAISPTAVWMWFEGKTLSLRGKNLLAASRFLGVLPQWLETGKGPMCPAGDEALGATDERDAYAFIKQVSLEVACGNGQRPERVFVKSTLAFRRDWLARKGLNPDTLEVYEAKGSSMSPHIEDGDALLVDVSVTAPKSGECWVFWQQESLHPRIKRLVFRENGDVVIRSDSSDKSQFPDEIVPAAMCRNLRMVGRVVWRGG